MHRHAGFEPDLLQSARGFSGDVIKVRRAAANHRAQRDNGVKPPRPASFFAAKGSSKAPGTWNTCWLFAPLW